MGNRQTEPSVPFPLGYGETLPAFPLGSQLTGCSSHYHLPIIDQEPVIGFPCVTLGIHNGDYVSAVIGSNDWVTFPYGSDS